MHFTNNHHGCLQQIPPSETPTGTTFQYCRCVCVALHHMDGRFDDTNLSKFYRYLRSSAQTTTTATKGLFSLKKKRESVNHFMNLSVVCT